MKPPTEEEAHEGPLRLQPVVARPGGWRGRSVNVVAVGLVGFVALGLVLGTALDNSGLPTSSAVAAASVAPAPTLRPTRRPTPAPLATPLPTVEINGPEIPTEHRLVYGNGRQILDLGTGTLRPFGEGYGDVAWTLGDEIVCVCVVRPDETVPSQPTLRFGRFDLTGAPIFERDLVSLVGVVAVPEMSEGFNIAAAMDTAVGRLVVVDVLRRPPDWVVELHVVDAETGELLDSVVVDTFPVAFEEPQRGASPGTDGGTPDGPPDGVYAWASAVAVAPDGGPAYVTVARSDVRGGQWTTRNLEWLVSIVDDRLGRPTPVPPHDSLAPDRWCVGWPTFVDAGLVVQVCASPSPSFETTSWSVRRVTTGGTSLGDVPIGALQYGGSIAAIVVDRARRAVYLWDPFRHLVSRVDVDDGRLHEGAVIESMLPGDRVSSNRSWIGVDPGLMASPDGTRIYALGLAAATRDVSPSTGVWVFDAETLALLDHWEPRALLTSLAVSDDGRFVYAVGAAEHDVDGNRNPGWQASVTAYDATTGEIAVLYGAIGKGQWFSFQSWP
jgi:DNA-binding beta-propeller fold protein YncE